jgi:hypothetical protein
MTALALFSVEWAILHQPLCVGELIGRFFNNLVFLVLWHVLIGAARDDKFIRRHLGEEARRR